MTVAQEILEPPVAEEAPSLAYGVCLFDGAEPQGGWACREHGEPFRVESPAGLSTDTIWWTNIAYELFRESGLSKHPWVRFNGYPRLTAQKALDEWGMKDVDPSRQVVLLAKLFGRLMRLAVRRLTAQRELKAYALHADFSRIFRPQSLPERDLAPAIAEAVQDWTRTQGRSGKDLRHVMLRRPRLDHAQYLARCPVPEGPWEYVQVSKMPAPPEKRAEWLAGLDRPVLARVIVSSDSDVGEVLAFGGGAHERRFWCAHPELKALCAFASVEVTGAYIGTGFSAGEDLFSGLDDILRSPIAATSWSVGLLAENLWVGACRQAEEGRQRRLTLRGCWMRSMDRTQLFLDAVHLHASGFIVLGYGVGGIHVAIDEDMMDELVDAAFRRGLMTPMSLTCNESGPTVSNTPDLGDWGGERGSGLLALVMAMGRPDLLWRLDGLFEEPRDRVRQELLGIQRELA